MRAMDDNRWEAKFERNLRVLNYLTILPACILVETLDSLRVKPRLTKALNIFFQQLVMKIEIFLETRLAWFNRSFIF
jgi:hypothetical protein